MTLIIDRVLDNLSLEFLYKETLGAPNWSLDRTSGDDDQTSFGGLSLLHATEKQIHGQIINSPYLCGYYISIYHKILCNFSPQVFQETPLPRRIHLGAKYKGNVGLPHTDSNVADDTTILFFNNPVWKTEWGGGIIVDNQLIEYVPGRAVIFSSTTNHYVSPILFDKTPIRLATNYIFRYNINKLGKNENANI